MSEEQKDQSKKGDSKEVLDAFCGRIAKFLGLKKPDDPAKIKKVFEQEEAKKNIEHFFKESDDTENIQHFYILPNNDTCKVEFQAVNLEKLKKKGILVLKMTQEAVKNVYKDIILTEIPKNILEHEYIMLNEVLGPVIQNPQNQVGFTDLVTKDLMEKFNNYIAQIYVIIGLSKGKTMLPIPSKKLMEDSNISEKDKAHIYESSIITWSKQIKNVLKLEPEMVLKQYKDPGPDKEIEFWENKAKNLNSIYDQINSKEVEDIKRFLENTKSTYTNPFSKLEREVREAKIEANSNWKYLKTLTNLFNELIGDSDEFSQKHEKFIPIMHTLLLIWQNSKYYKTPPRLVVLIREICNAIIQKAQNYIPGSEIISCISSENPEEACNKLQIAIEVCTKFKEAYFEYKAKAQGEWKLTTNALFVRLDSFLERAHDIYHLTNTIVQFKKLEKIELGGTKGKTLTETVNQIYREFEQAVKDFSDVQSHYDIMDIDEKEKRFDDDFYKFRSKIKELERRLASVITQGFDDMDTIQGRFKVLESFDGLLNRPIIQDELEKKHIILLETYKFDLKTVQQIFLEGKSLIDNNSIDKAPVYNNMPPIAGIYTWSNGLLLRMSEPLEKLKSLGSIISEREEYKDVLKLHESITKQINQYNKEKILSWEKEVDAQSDAKLNLPLLIKNESGKLKVNFDAALVRLLREVKYFKLLDQKVPEKAENIFAKNDQYRDQICQLDLIVNNYNNIITCLHPVEEPLIKERIEQMDTDLKPGLDELKWNANEQIQKYISKTKQIVDSTNEVVLKMKESIEKIQKALNDINRSILERKNRAITLDDFQLQHGANFAQRQITIKEASSMIHKQLKEVLDAVKTDKKSPIWKAYIDYVNEIVLEGIAQAIITALKHLNDQIDPENIRKHLLAPLFEIKLDLSDKQIQYDPLIEESLFVQNTVINVVKGWICDFFQISNFILRLDKSDPSDYLQEMRDYFEIKYILAQITNNLEYIEQETKEFKEKFMPYKFLWTQDPEESFNQFLIDNEPQQDDLALGGDDDDDDQDNAGKEQKQRRENPLLKGARAKIPNLDLFDDQITNLKNIQGEVQKWDPEKNIAWLKISVQPLKSALNAKINVWINVYTSFLKNQFQITLKNVRNFIQQTKEGISKNPSDPENLEDKELLKNVMKIISNIHYVEPKTEGIIKRMKDMVTKLKKHGVVLQGQGEEEPFQAIDNQSAQFTETVQMIIKIKSQILKQQNDEQKELRKKIEKFKIKVQEFRNLFKQNLPFSFSQTMEFQQINSAYDLIQEYHQKLFEIEKEAQEFTDLEKLFELERTDYKQIKDCKKDLKNLKTMWDTISMVMYMYKDWKTKQWRSIKADSLLELNKGMQLQIKNLPKEIRNFPGFAPLQEITKNMGTVLPLVSALHSEFMEKRHWLKIQQETGKTFDHTSPNFNFEDILDLELYKYENQVNEIVDIAQKEAKIEKKLKSIQSAWATQRFYFEDCNETFIFASLDDMIELVDANSLDLMGMKSQGKYVENFIVEVEQWRFNLEIVSTVIDEWLKVQKDWKQLVNIFLKAEDIKAQLSEETKLFEGVDREFRDIMIEATQNPLVLEACTAERKDVLHQMNLNIKKCEKSLNDYLEQKKKSFPRFYFLSNQSLLTILSNGTNPPKVCEFLADCFDQFKTLLFRKEEPGKDISKRSYAMTSKHGEVIMFKTNDYPPGLAHMQQVDDPIKVAQISWGEEKDFVADGQVENWLCDLEYKMRETLYDVLKEAKQSSEMWDVTDQQNQKREEWVRDYPAQIALLTTQIVWTEDVTRAFEDLAGGSESAMKDCLKLIENRIDALIRKVRGDLTFLERNKIINIITIDVHSRDVVEKFCINKVQEPESFAWLSQLKFEWNNKDADVKQAKRYPWEKSKEQPKCIVRIVDWFRYYTYEYVGNEIRLVVTPLTDRCYITLTQALNLNMGGAPAGPAGTGKTETTKDLGRGIGIYVVVFNCSDQMTKDSLAQVFMGLSQSGSWGCFDEFNRISIEVLSVVSSQVKCVLDALKEKAEKFRFTDVDDINLQDTVGFFITMNPGYAGRTELPENLKALFRSCAMVVPDLLLICENMLMSEGFQKARSLSKKFVSLYQLSKELLSKARHYDWGLRAVKSVLRQAGALKRTDPLMDEDPLLMRALRDFNMPKIVTDDKPIFKDLIGDLFPKMDAPLKTDPDLKKAVQITAKQEMGLYLDIDDMFATKVIQLKEILEVRHCCFILGPPGSGKTTVWKTLAKTFNSEFFRAGCVFDILNPKGVTSDELFGAYTKTKEWKNGVLSCIMKAQSKSDQPPYNKHQKHQWSVLDGDIDPEWIESLNTVMDDNKVLTLVSNDRIPLTPPMRLLFEIADLRNATPATVSRAGVLFINETDIGWMPYMNAWLDRSIEKKQRQLQKEQFNEKFASPEINEIAKNVFYRCFQTYIENNIEIFKIAHISPYVDIMFIQTLCTILDALLTIQGEQIQALGNEDQQRISYEALFEFAGMWAIGGSIGGGQDDEKDQKDFNSQWRAISKVRYPEGGLVFDYFWKIEEGQSGWHNWSNVVPQYVHDEELSFTKIYVQTMFTCRFNHLIQLHVQRNKPVLFIGGAGSGKTAVIQDYLKLTNSELISHRTINFNSFTDSLALQRNIETMVEKKSGKNFGSATNKTLIYFIDDMNMPYVDKYGTQSPIALLRQIQDSAHIFNRDQLEEKKYIQDLLFFGCMNQKAGSFSIDTRLQRHFSTFTMFTPGQDLIKQIYAKILDGHLSKFDSSVSKLGDKIIDATISVFNKLLKDTQFSPSARKFHYQFNLRELSKVIEGTMLSNASHVKYKASPATLIKLWCHEGKRVFEDRMINNDDMKKFRDFQVDAVQKLLGEEFVECTKDEITNPCLFNSFISQHLGNEKNYLPTDWNELNRVLSEKLEEYNEVKAQMNLVLFNDAMGHISRIARILDFPTGHALLIGVGGSGKQSLSRLASFIVGYEVMQLVVTASFNINDLRNFLQELYKKIAKPAAAPIIFMITDTQIKEEQFLIPINDILNSGWISDLFPKEDVEAMMGNLRNEAKSQGVPDAQDKLWQYFLDKMRRNLKIILCFSPVGENMRIKSRKFPGLINACSMDWFHSWPRDALQGVAKKFIQDIEDIDTELKERLANNMAEVHVSIDEANLLFLKNERRFNYTTPKSFLELISFYKKVFGENVSQIKANIDRYERGLDILDNTSQKVEGLKQELAVKMVDVVDKRQKTDILIQQVGEASEIAGVQQKAAQEEEDKTNKAAESAGIIKKRAEDALAEAVPALKRAEEAVKGIVKNDISNMKALGNPPEMVAVTAKAVMYMFGEKIPYNDPPEKTWKKGQQFLNNPSQFILNLEAYNGKQIDQFVLDNVKKIVDQYGDNFTAEKVGKISTPAGLMCSWVLNILTFNRIFKEVKPLQEAKDAAEADLSEKMIQLEKVKAQVRQLTEQVAELQRQLQEAQENKQKVEDEAASCQQKLDAAEKLVNGLSDEHKRWSQNVKVLKQNTKSIIGDVMLASSFISYIGPFNAKFRQNIQNKWVLDIGNFQIPITQGKTAMETLTTVAKMAQWKNEGLPADPMSLENATIITSCERWPLLIDPQLQGSTWIRQSQSENLVVIQLTQPKYLNALMNAVQMGKFVLIEGVQQEIDATLDPLLSRAIKKKGQSYVLDMGGEQIDYDINFKLYLMTKLFNPHFRPETAAQCTIINFIVTESGLEDQLLAAVVNKERADIEEKKQELVKAQNEFKVQLDKLERDLLETLSRADPDTILENKELIQQLDTTKKTANDIQEQTAAAKITEQEINQLREIYRPVAAEGAMLYFLIITLNVVDHMYQYSLDAFYFFFYKAIERTTQNDETRIQKLIDNIRYTIYQWVSRGLFEKHKIIFLTLITFRLMQKKVIDIQYDPAQMEFLIKCVPKPGVENTLDWLPQIAWDSIQSLIQLEEFKSFAQNIEKDAPNRFKDWYNELQPEDQKLPLDWKKLESMPFQKLLVLRCLRPDRIINAMTNFIRHNLPYGDQFVEMDSKLSFTEVLESSINDSQSSTPIFFILSPGADPVSEVQKIAKKRGLEVNKTFHYLALGQGQDETARRKLEEGNKEGHWVMLQNIQLMPRWLSELEKILDNFGGDQGGGNPNFRLFLSADPSPDVPIGILDRSIKLTNEPPAGLKANMKRAWTYFTKEEIEDKDIKVKSILFALCFFHSTVIERRRFGPKGWNMNYPFSTGDLRDSYLVMNRYIEQSSGGKVPFEDLIYIFGEIMYGGHIVDDWDRRLCIAYLRGQMNETLFDELELFPFIEGKNLSFKVPPPNSYEKYLEHIETLGQETPLAYGLHPNTEIGFRTQQCNILFNTLLELQPKDSGENSGGGEAKSKNEIAADIIKYILEEKDLKSMYFNLEELKTSIDQSNKGPFQNVFLQEIEYMNILLKAIGKSLENIQQGFQGILTISEQMEKIIDALALNRVPESWTNLAYSSKRGLQSWLQNLFKRIEQLNLFKENPIELPKVIMISRFFNPQSFLTAIKQVIGRKQAQELNKLYIATDVTKKTVEEIDQAAKDGSYVFGLICEGARWDTQGGVLEESRPKEMFCLMPVVYCKALPIPEVGKEDKTLYKCPVYKTEDRGNTYVFEAQLKTRLEPRKWILAGVVMLMDVEGVADDVKKK